MQKYADYTPAQAAWLDELPSHWQCTKIGALFSERKSKVSDKDYAPLSVARIGVVSQLIIENSYVLGISLSTVALTEKVHAV